MWAAHVGAEGRGGEGREVRPGFEVPRRGGVACGTRRQAAIGSAREHVRTTEGADGGADARVDLWSIIAPGAGSVRQ